MKKLKILFYPNASKKSKKTNQIPIYLRVSKGSNKAEAKLDVYIDESDLELWNTYTQRLDKPGNQINKKIEDVTEDFNSLRYTFKEEYKTFCPNDIKKKLFGSEGDKEFEKLTVLGYCEDYYQKTVLLDTNISLGTKKNYRKAINHLIKFLDYIKKTKITMQNYSPELAFGFYEYLQREIKEIKKKAIKDYSAASVVMKIKAIFQRAYDIELIKRHPFKRVKLQKDYPKKPELTIAEINEIIKLYLKENLSIKIYLDVFLFGVFTGLPYGDLYNLKWTNIVEEKGEFVLEKDREKTDMPVKQILVSQAVDIIMKYKDSNSPENKLLPVRHLNDMNEKLKLIQAWAGINKNLTTHIVRHTCNQFLNDLGCINSNVINSMLGWSNKREGTRINYMRMSFDQLYYAKQHYQLFLDTNISKIIN